VTSAHVQTLCYDTYCTITWQLAKNVGHSQVLISHLLVAGVVFVIVNPSAALPNLGYCLFCFHWARNMQVEWKTIPDCCSWLLLLEDALHCRLDHSLPFVSLRNTVPRLSHLVDGAAEVMGESPPYFHFGHPEEICRLDKVTYKVSQRRGERTSTSVFCMEISWHYSTTTILPPLFRTSIKRMPVPLGCGLKSLLLAWCARHRHEEISLRCGWPSFGVTYSFISFLREDLDA
jgi:hypothetical protein